MAVQQERPEFTTTFLIRSLLDPEALAGNTRSHPTMPLRRKLLSPLAGDNLDQYRKLFQQTRINAQHDKEYRPYTEAEIYLVLTRIGDSESYPECAPLQPYLENIVTYIASLNKDDDHQTFNDLHIFYLSQQSKDPWIYYDATERLREEISLQQEYNSHFFSRARRLLGQIVFGYEPWIYFEKTFKARKTIEQYMVTDDAAKERDFSPKGEWFWWQEDQGETEHLSPKGLQISDEDPLPFEGELIQSKPYQEKTLSRYDPHGRPLLIAFDQQGEPSYIVEQGAQLWGTDSYDIDEEEYADFRQSVSEVGFGLKLFVRNLVSLDRKDRSTTLASIMEFIDVDNTDIDFDRVDNIIETVSSSTLQSRYILFLLHHLSLYPYLHDKEKATIMERLVYFEDTRFENETINTVDDTIVRALDQEQELSNITPSEFIDDGRYLLRVLLKAFKRNSKFDTFWRNTQQQEEHRLRSLPLEELTQDPESSLMRYSFGAGSVSPLRNP